MADRDPYDIHMLEPDAVSLCRGRGGVLQGTIEGKPYGEIAVHRAFPFLYTTKYISLRDPKGEEIGIVRDMEQLDDESREELTQELQYRYFLPKVTRVNKVKPKNDLWIWDLETNKGPARLLMRNLHEHMQFPSENRIVLTDMSGRRCEISDWKALDSHSRKQLSDIV